jgi:hypothetical protein
MIVKATQDVYDRIMVATKVCEKTGCWLCMSADRGIGYATAWFEGKLVLAHRMVYHHLFSNPSQFAVMHTCDVRNCVNPDHLRLGTQQMNVDDMMCKGRNVPSIGERNGQATLTDEDVAQIRGMYSTGLYFQREIADAFGVHQVHVSRIVRRTRRNA